MRGGGFHYFRRSAVSRLARKIEKKMDLKSLRCTPLMTLTSEERDRSDHSYRRRCPLDSRLIDNDHDNWRMKSLYRSVSAVGPFRSIGFLKIASDLFMGMSVLGQSRRAVFTEVATADKTSLTQGSH